MLEVWLISVVKCSFVLGGSRVEIDNITEEWKEVFGPQICVQVHLLSTSFALHASLNRLW
jgi:hypothetical protein